MTLYSNTRLSQFENCRYAYDLRYNRKVETPFESIEAFMGKMVHMALERLYTARQDDEIVPLEKLLEYYSDMWDIHYHDEMIYNKWTEYDWKDIGSECITDYYERMKPFDSHAVVGIETDEVLELPDGNTWSVRIDRLDLKDRVFYVCDYKTSGRMKSQWEADTDRQLAMYAYWVHQRYGAGIRVKLVWHMLRFNQDVESDRNRYELDREVSKVMDEIAEIEACDSWPTNPGSLCNWCSYRHICPEFRDEYQREDDL